MKRQQSDNQFQTQDDQLMTYSFSDHIPPPTAHLQNKPIKKFNQHFTLSIIRKDINLNNFGMQKAEQCRRNTANKRGNIIRIGKALFKSNFQCGNLGTVVCQANNTFKITMDKEANSNRLSNWFYFRCEGLKGQITFIITGFIKKSSLFNSGMKVCFRDVTSPPTDWKRGCSKISYSAADNQDFDEDGKQFQLKFKHYFKNNQSHPVQFAYCFPYTYTRVIELSKTLSCLPFVQNGSIGTTYENREIPVLTIGNLSATKSIVLSARVHPGQSVSSFIMEGFLKELVSDCKLAQNLREQYLIKVVPMINPDGVVRGNYRFSASGYDLNRRWKNSQQTSHPQIFYLKRMIRALNKQKPVAMYIDIHGHSRKKSAFFYGCGSSSYDQEQVTKPKQFPYLMEKINSNFKYEFCTFSVSKDKEGTARISMWKELNIHHVYTLESSFCGSVSGPNYLEKDYLKLGKSLLKGISIFFYDQNLAMTKEVKPTFEQIQMAKSVKLSDSADADKQSSYSEDIPKFRQSAINQLKKDKCLLKVGDKDDSGSDSEPQAGLIPEQQRRQEQLNSRQKSKALRESDQKADSKTNGYYKSTKFVINSSKKISIKLNSTRTSQLKKQKTNITSEQLKDVVKDKMKKILQTPIKYKNKDTMMKTTNSFHTYDSQHLNSFTTNAFIPKNQRVHSKLMNKPSINRIRNTRVNSQFYGNTQPQNGQLSQKLRVDLVSRSLLKSRQGVQYRRVKKIAEEFRNRSIPATTTGTAGNQSPLTMVRGVSTMRSDLGVDNNSLNKTIISSFYPSRNERGRRNPRDGPFKANKMVVNFSGKNFFINGDQLSVHCKGKHVSHY